MAPSAIRGSTRQSFQRIGATRIGATALGSVAAASAWLLTRWIAARLMWSPGVSGIAAFCAAWVALFPLARLNRSVPAWAHWARGGFVLIVLWLLILFSR